MVEEFEDEKIRRDKRMRSFGDYARGAIFILFGLFFLFFRKLNIQGLEYKDFYPYIGGLFVLYGFWRFYRGYKKNYYR